MAHHRTLAQLMAALPIILERFDHQLPEHKKAERIFVVMADLSIRAIPYRELVPLHRPLGLASPENLVDAFRDFWRSNCHPLILIGVDSMTLIRARKSADQRHGLPTAKVTS